MARVCTVCSHARRAAIERELAAAKSVRGTARKYNLSASALQRHARSCAREAIASASGEREADLGSRLLAEIQDLHRRTLEMLPDEPSLLTADHAIKIIREARRNLELVARLTGQFAAKPVSVEIGVKRLIGVPLDAI